MRTSTAVALYSLSVDAFIEGLAEEVVPPQAFGLTEKQGVEVRSKIYQERLREKREKREKARAA